MIDPITREEFLLAKALGENVPDIVPVIRKEMYLAKIAGADIQTPEAITREEMYLDAIANGTEVNIEPITRKEMFYAKALGLIENAPEPITRIEGLLNQITVGGGGGSYDKYSWEGVFASIKAGTYATDYAIGDTVPLDLGSEGVINMRIIAFDTDNLADGSGKAPITWMATAPLTTTHRWNPAVVQNDDGSYKEGTGSIGGWGKSELRTYLNDTVKALIPANVRNAIKEVTKNSRSFDTSKNVVETISNDYLWPFSNYELKHIVPSYEDKENTGVTYPSVTKDMLIMPQGDNIWYNYWLRTANYNEKTVYIIQSHYVEFKSYPTNSIYNYPHFCFCT